MSAQEWKPPLPAFDFLSMMDAPTSPPPTKKVLECMKEQGVQESAEQPREGPPTARRGPAEVLRIKHWNKSNWPKEAEESSRHHKEL